MNAPLPSAHCKILFVDDDGPFRTYLARFLAAHHFEALAAPDGPTGLALARQLLPDLVLCDLEMPGMDGYEFLKAMHRDPATTAIPVIFLTGRAAPAQVRFGMNLGADDYLTKPVNPEDLFQAIKVRLARSRQRLAAARPVQPSAHSGLDDTFVIKTRTEDALVKIRSLTRILAYGEYSWVYWEPGKGTMLRKSLKQWLHELPEEQFVRVHRGAIINLAYLERVEKLPDGRVQLHLRDRPEPIPVSLRLRPVLNRKLQHLQPGAAAASVTSSQN